MGSDRNNWSVLFQVLSERFVFRPEAFDISPELIQPFAFAALLRKHPCHRHRHERKDRKHGNGRIGYKAYDLAGTRQFPQINALYGAFADGLIRGIVGIPLCGNAVPPRYG